MKVKSCGDAIARGKGRDLLVIMEQCKLTDKADRFVQVTCAPEPMAVLATGQQLVDLQ